MSGLVDGVVLVVVLVLVAVHVHVMNRIFTVFQSLPFATHWHCDH